ncbi:hypothetical protein [Clostridium beijerinckii]|uniref:Uncharacterized protein n=1 Tax=Clostridium beijerinckii TaxID=1520 RepID=A0AAX0B7D4_CLOBE|nr:hypothetical protein [Clostridium beijerinckii]NRT91277.1 hypothetical protein [Clostridium beijerinckii]NYC70803.1 hypothetical protein [Clostridium beijerinckii]
MGFFGNLVHAVAGAIASVANAVINALSPVVESGGVVGEIAGEVSDVAKSVLGASTEVADVSEDGEIDDEEAEELIEDTFKLLVGAFIATFGSGSSDSNSEVNGERIVISGNHVEPYLTRNFIETAIKQIKDWKSENNEGITWVVVDSGYTDTDKTLMKEVAKDNGVNIMFIDDRSDLINYINKGEDEGGNVVEDRSVNKITDVSIFSHGLRNDGGILALNYEAGGDLNISSNELADMNIDREAFLNPHTYFGSCNSATVVDEKSFASEWVKRTGGEAEAICDPTPYSEEQGGQSSYYDINNQNYQFKIADKVRMISGINFKSEGADNYPKKFVNPKNQEDYEDIHWVRIHEDGSIENIDVGGPRK